VLLVEEVERPVPKDDEILIRVRAATVSQTDTHVRAAHPFEAPAGASLRYQPEVRRLALGA
jgi:NADPH:quinone reductase-like Zn-dependent oxidoreductase